MFANASGFLVQHSTFNEVHGDLNQGARGLSGLQILDRVVAAGAMHDSAERFPPPKCHPRTRLAIMNDILGWIKDPNHSSKILWLNGPAGAGKSAIAQTISELCADDDILVASFFFSRRAHGRNHAKQFFTTIAYQLAVNIPSLRPIIEEAVDVNPLLPTKSMDLQFSQLIVEPIQSKQETISPPKVIIIDGLDECRERDDQTRILQLIGRACGRQLPICFFIASRPEPNIRDAFDSLVVRRSSRCLVLNDYFHPDNDIKIFLQSGFSDILEKHRRTMQSVRCWPSEADLRTLVFRSSGQFIYAATVLKFVDDRRYRPTDRLNVILGTTPAQKSSTAFADLDALYSQILSSSSNTPETFRILGALIVIHMEDLFYEYLDHFSNFVEDLLFIQRGDIYLALSGLHSLFQVPDPLDPKMAPAPVLPFHRSFNDYLVDHLRSKELCVDLGTSHADLTRCCLRALMEVYHPGFNFGVEGSISTEVWVYASRTWCLHCINANPDRELMDDLEAFSVVQWVEWCPGTADPDEEIEPLVELAKVLEWLSSNPSSATQRIFQTYSTSLDAYFTDSLAKCARQDKLPLLLGVLVFSSISPYDARVFLELSGEDMPGILNPLISIISSDYLHCDPLFRAFLVDPARAGNHLVDSSTHTRVIIRYLEYIMSQASPRGFPHTFLPLTSWISHLPLAFPTVELLDYLRALPSIVATKPSVRSLVTTENNIQVVLDWLQNLKTPSEDVIACWQELQDTTLDH